MPQKEKNILINTDVKWILTIIENNGYEAKIVGGAVRNFLMKKQISDIDIATTATPEKIINIFKKENIKTIPTGIDHGTVTIIYNKSPYEITTLRRDVESFGRKAKVSFTESFLEDSKRRDFSINAIYMDKNGNIFDPQNGIKDIQTKTIKFIGDPSKRIQEDFLRILRYFRFSAIHGDCQCSKEYLNIIEKNLHHLHKLASERIISELLKIFEISDAYKIVNQMQDLLNELFNITDNPLEHLEALNIYNMNSYEKLALILSVSSVDQILKNHNLPKKIKKMLQLSHCNSSSIIDIQQHLKTTSNIFHKFIIYRFLYKQKISENNLDIIKNQKNQLEKFCNSGNAAFPLKAQNLSDLNLSKKTLQQIMMKTKSFWITSSKQLTYLDCLNFATRLSKKSIALKGKLISQIYNK